MTEIFAQKVREQIASAEVRKKCCRYTADAMAELESDPEQLQKLREVWEKCRCDGCRLVWIRTMFVWFGSVTDPEKAYHLDFTVRGEDTAELLSGILEESGFGFRRTTRLEKQVLYLKEHGAIEDFLLYLGAQTAAFDYMNSKINHEFKNSVNRQINCDTANLKKQVDAGRKYGEAIRYLASCGELESLPAELRETAQLRLENEQLSLAQLGELANPPVSKSGVRHRLEKLLSAAEALREENRNGQ